MLDCHLCYVAWKLVDSHISLRTKNNHWKSKNIWWFFVIWYCGCSLSLLPSEQSSSLMMGSGDAPHTSKNTKNMLGNKICESDQESSVRHKFYEHGSFQELADSSLWCRLDITSFAQKSFWCWSQTPLTIFDLLFYNNSKLSFKGNLCSSFWERPRTLPWKNQSVQSNWTFIYKNSAACLWAWDNKGSASDIITWQKMKKKSHVKKNGLFRSASVQSPNVGNSVQGNRKLTPVFKKK